MYRRSGSSLFTPIPSFRRFVEDLIGPLAHPLIFVFGPQFNQSADRGIRFEVTKVIQGCHTHIEGLFRFHYRPEDIECFPIGLHFI